MAIAGHGDGFGRDSEGSYDFREFSDGQACMQALAKKLLRAFIFLTCMFLHEPFDFRVTARSIKISHEKETSRTQDTQHFAEKTVVAR